MNKLKFTLFFSVITLAMILLVFACNSNKESATDSDAAKKVYVAPGKYDELYSFMSGGFSGQLSVYGLPSGRLFRVIPVFSQDPEKGWGLYRRNKTYAEYITRIHSLGRCSPS